MALSFNSSNDLYDFVIRKGNGVKGVSDLGLSEVPEKFIQPPEQRINKENSRTCDAPPIDLSKLNGPEHEKVVDEIVRASETLGFFQVVNHGVPLELLESLKHAAHAFFNLPSEEKAVYQSELGLGQVTKFGSSFAPEREKIWEWKDFMIMIYRSDDEALRYWPIQCREAALEYLKLSSNMVRDIVKILIGRLGVSVDDAKLEGLLGMKYVTMNYYPPCPSPELTAGVARHSDKGTMTVLLQDEIGGLYVKMEHDNDVGKEEWLEIPPIPGALVINIADILQILSNGKYKSAEHRTSTTSTKARVSIPLFVLPMTTEKIGPLLEVVKNDGFAQYKEFLMQDYLNNFVGNAHDGKKALDFAKINSA